MSKSKNLRSRCALASCRKQFRHADARATVCSSACRQAAYRIRRKADQERERLDAAVLWFAEKQKRQAKAKAEQEAAERERQAAARQAEEERRRSQPQPKPAPEPDDRRGWVGIGGLGPYEEEKQIITIPREPSYIPTPLGRGRR